MTVHELKCWPGPFAAVLNGTKRYEIRSTADRHFAIGDVLVLHEWVPQPGVYTGRSLKKTVSYLTAPGEFGLPENLCVMSLEAR